MLTKSNAINSAARIHARTNCTSSRAPSVRTVASPPQRPRHRCASRNDRARALVASDVYRLRGVAATRSAAKRSVVSIRATSEASTGRCWPHASSDGMTGMCFPKHDFCFTLPWGGLVVVFGWLIGRRRCGRRRRAVVAGVIVVAAAGSSDQRKAEQKRQQCNQLFPHRNTPFRCSDRRAPRFAAGQVL